jgi:DNA-binding NtrC family response regulator
MLKILDAVKGMATEIEPLLRGHEVHRHGEGEPLLERVSKGNYNLALVEGGPAIIGPIKEADPRVEVVLFGGDRSEAIQALKSGACAYYSRPFDERGFVETLKHIRENFEIRKETAELERLLHEKYTFAGIVGRNPRMLDIFSFIRRIAPYYRLVLITGETGTGKEVVAKALHRLASPGSPFIVCNCGSLTENLVESELFGHLKGSFTGAVSDREGLFDAAGEGAVFLDEIGELPPTFQPRFLRVLQDGEFRPVGSSRPRTARCRVIAATNRVLPLEVEGGRFRRDLYYRLSALVINLPPLRERKDDIPLLTRALLGRFIERTGKKISGISRPAQDILMSCDWPGNVRELENVLEQAAMMTGESFIRVQDLPADLKAPSKIKPIASLESFIMDHIEETLKKFGGNRTRTAEALGISRRALIRKIEKYSIR